MTPEAAILSRAGSFRGLGIMNRSDLLLSAVEKREAAFEIKFLVPVATADKVLAWARLHLAPDPHAGTEEADGYGVNTRRYGCAEQTESTITEDLRVAAPIQNARKNDSALKFESQCG